MSAAAALTFTASLIQILTLICASYHAKLESQVVPIALGKCAFGNALRIALTLLLTLLLLMTIPQARSLPVRQQVQVQYRIQYMNALGNIQTGCHVT